MNILLEKSITSTLDDRSNKAIIEWWEQKRIFYNSVFVTVAFGVITLAISFDVMSLMDTTNVLRHVLILAFSANIFYTLGWIIEIGCSEFITNRGVLQKTGPIFFIAGIVSSLCFSLAIDAALFITFIAGNKILLKDLNQLSTCRQPARYDQTDQ